jgi:voltage-dependent anion channel protein 2
MAPPAYADLGKNARDVFGKGYHFGLWKLDCKTKTNSGVEFTTAGHSNQDTGKVFGSLETKYKVKEHGLTFSEKWNTDNTLTSEVSVEDQLVKGLKLSFDGSFAPQTGLVVVGMKCKYKVQIFDGGGQYVFSFVQSSSRNKTGRFKTTYSHERVRVDGDVNVDLAGPLVNASGVFGYQGWLAGYQLAFDSQKSKITANNFALGYKAGDFVLHTNV